MTQCCNCYISLFQSTLLQEERRHRCMTCAGPLCISIHAPTRGATKVLQTRAYRQTISIHAPTRGATSAGGRRGRNHHYFNPRSYKRSDLFFSVSFLHWLYFNPRSYKRSDLQDFQHFNFTVLISIHAPTRGATHIYMTPPSPMQFQSTLLQEERLLP